MKAISGVFVLAAISLAGLTHLTTSGHARRNLKVRLHLGLVLAAIALVLPGAASAGMNVVPNPGFEQGGCGSTPVICGWDGFGLMSQDTTQPHSGAASMSLSCGFTGCYGSGGSASLSARTEPVFCAAIGPGSHPASFWYRGDPEEAVQLSAAFFQTPDCTGTASGDFFGDWANGDYAWHEVTGDVYAPPGTESAFFYISAGYPCDDFCSIRASFDDLDVEDTAVPDTTPPETTITYGPSGTTSSTSESFEFTANEPATFECRLDTAPFVACHSPAAYTGLGPGSHAFQVRATDMARNTDPTPAERSWTIIDTTPPETTITSGPSGTTNSSSATFEFTADEPATFECSLDATPFVACSSPASYSSLGDGAHNFSVQATDTAGNSDSTPAERTWNVQANLPPVPRFAFSCSALTCSFDASASSDPDGSIATYAWDFGDGATASGVNVSHSYGAAGTYTARLTLIDNNGATASDSKAVAPISLNARGYKVKGFEKVDLAWSGPSGVSFAVYRNGTNIATVQATFYTDNLNEKGSGSYVYRVCAPAASSCSDEAKVRF